MHECSGFRRPRRGGAAARFTHTSDPGTNSCAFTVSLLLTAATPDRDGPVRNTISLCHSVFESATHFFALLLLSRPDIRVQSIEGTSPGSSEVFASYLFNRPSK